MTQVDELRAWQARGVERAIQQYRESVEGKVAVVTGGARGIGKTMSEALTKAGAKVVAADRTWNGSDQFKKELEAAQGLAVEMDVTDDAQLDAAYDAVMKKYGTADILINCAALVSETLFAPTGRVKTLDTKDDDWEAMFKVNVFGVVKTIRRFIKPMLEKQRGSILNVVSSGVLPIAAGGGWFGLRPWTTEMPYQATKAAVMALGFYLGYEVQSQGVAVNAIMPGHTRASWFDTTARAWKEKGQVYGFRPVVAEHIVPITLFLAGQDGSNVSGMLYSVTDWNYDHGFGNYGAWADHTFPPDLEEMYSKAEASMPASGPRMGVSTPASRR